MEVLSATLHLTGWGIGGDHSHVKTLKRSVPTEIRHLSFTVKHRWKDREVMCEGIAVTVAVLHWFSQFNIRILPV